LKQKGIQGEIVPKIGRYNLVKSTTLASKKSHNGLDARAGSPVGHREIGAFYLMRLAGIIRWMRVQDPLAQEYTRPSFGHVRLVA
jgi:hypothetical protein